MITDERIAELRARPTKADLEAALREITELAQAERTRTRARGIKGTFPITVLAIANEALGE